MPTYDSAISPPYPALLVNWPAPASVRDVDASLFSWLGEVFALDLRGFSAEEMLFALKDRPGFDASIASVIAHFEDIRTSIRCLQARGFSTILADFEELKAAAGGPAETMRRLQDAFGGVQAVVEGRRFLAIPMPAGEWAVTDGTRLQRLWSSPFADARFPLS